MKDLSNFVYELELRALTVVNMFAQKHNRKWSSIFLKVKIGIEMIKVINK